MPHKSLTHHESQKIIFSKILFHFFQYGTGRILKKFHFWGSYKFPLDHLILVLYGYIHIMNAFCNNHFVSWFQFQNSILFKEPISKLLNKYISTKSKGKLSTLMSWRNSLMVPHNCLSSYFIQLESIKFNTRYICLYSRYLN